mgnify:FL=1
MINIGILDFLMSTAHHIFAINCSSNFEYTDNLFEKILTAKYCTADINLGVFYIRKNSDNNYLLIDGKRRLLSLMLLLKAIADFQEEQSPDNPYLAKQINTRYLKFLEVVKLSLFGLEKTVYEKIINKEPLSYNEKQTEVYRTFQLFKDDIRHLEFELEDFYELFGKVTANVVFVENDYNPRELFYLLNKDSRYLNQLMLIKSYLAELKYPQLVNDLYYLFGYKEEVFVSFFKSYLSPKFNRVIKDSNSVYDYFVKYIDMVKQYQSLDDIAAAILKTAKIYKKMYNAEFMDSDLRSMFIKIISNNGRDTFSYLLELCEDYENKYLSKETLLEVCTIINTYLWERTKKSSLVNENFDFSKMVHELNQVIYDEQSSAE